MARLAIGGFAGLANRHDPLDGLITDSAPVRFWCATATNVDIDDKGGVRRRVGRQPIGQADAVYAQRDRRRWFRILAGELYEALSPTPLASVGPGPYAWDDAGHVSFLRAAASAWAIYPHQTIPWGLPTPPAPRLECLPEGALPPGAYQIACTFYRHGIESGASASARAELATPGALQCLDIPRHPGAETWLYASDPDGDRHWLLVRLAPEDPATTHLWRRFTPRGAPLTSAHFYPPPPGPGLIAFFAGRMWCGVYAPDQDITTLFPSRALGFHHFALDDPALVMIPGRLSILAATPSGLLIGTERAIHALVALEDGGFAQSPVADFGAIPGALDWLADGRALYLTTRGPARGLPHEMLTEGHFIPPTAALGAGLFREAAGLSQFLFSLAEPGPPYHHYP